MKKLSTFLVLGILFLVSTVKCTILRISCDSWTCSFLNPHNFQCTKLIAPMAVIAQMTAAPLASIPPFRPFLAAFDGFMGVISTTSPEEVEVGLSELFGTVDVALVVAVDAIEDAMDVALELPGGGGGPGILWLPLETAGLRPI